MEKCLPGSTLGLPLPYLPLTRWGGRQGITTQRKKDVHKPVSKREARRPELLQANYLHFQAFGYVAPSPWKNSHEAEKKDGKFTSNKEEKKAVVPSYNDSSVHCALPRGLP